MEPIFSLKNNLDIMANRQLIEADVPLHTHDCYDMELVVSGRAKHVVNGQSYEISGGDIYVLSPSDFHSLTVYEPLVTYNVMFTENAVFSPLLFDLVSNNVSLTYKLNEVQYARIRELFEILAREENIASYSDRFLKNLCECIIIKLLECFYIERRAVKPKKTIYTAALYIYRNFKNDISLKTLSDEIGYSPNHFSRLFNEVFGMGVTEYITDVRLGYAKKLLLSTDTPVTDICFESGFSSFSTFSRTFKKKYGISPREMKTSKKYM